MRKVRFKTGKWLDKQISRQKLGCLYREPKFIQELISHITVWSQHSRLMATLLHVGIHKPAPSNFLFTISYALPSGEGNGTQLQYSCLENPMDGGAW